TVKLDVGPVLVAHLHGDLREGERARLELKLDKSGAPVVLAYPDKDTPHMQDDPQLREMTCDPTFRRVLITDGCTPVGQAMARSAPASCSSASPRRGNRFRAWTRCVLSNA